MKKLLFLIVLVGLFLTATRVSNAQCDSNDRACLQNEIDQYVQKITQLQGQANTLSNQIASFNAQIKLAELKVQQTEDEINLLGGRIDQVSASLTSLNEAFSARAVLSYKMARTEEASLLLLSSEDLNDAVSKFHYLQKVEGYDQSLISKLQSAQNTYIADKKESEDLQKKLQANESALNSQRIAKTQLLNDTKGSEANYQRLLAAAQAQLSSLMNFAVSVGDALIPHQDLSDSFGKYYNQRDSQWGAISLNGTSYSIASAGCLATSYAMVVSHFGGSLIPTDVATNPSNFWSGTALFNKPGPDANGHGASAIDNPSIQQLKDLIGSGAVIIAGLSKDGGPYPQHYADHWVVLRSVDGDSFMINDPLYPSSMNVHLNDHYSSWTIIEAEVYH